jgi:hypothetical protein
MYQRVAEQPPASQAMTVYPLVSQYNAVALEPSHPENIIRDRSNSEQAFIG